MELKDRKRKLDLTKLTQEQAEAISIEIGKKIAQIMDDANLKCNEILNIYGMQTSIGYKIVKLNNKNKKSSKNKESVKV